MYRAWIMQQISGISISNPQATMHPVFTLARLSTLTEHAGISQ